MRFERSALAINTTDPKRAAAFYVEHLEMTVDLDIGWFISLRHAEHPELEISLMKHDHESIPEQNRAPAKGVSFAVVVESVDEVHRSLVQAEVPIVAGPTDHPWGQRQILAAAPDGVLLDVIEQIAPDHQWLRENGLLQDS